MAFSDDITTYIPDYKLVPSSFADAGDTGLTTGAAYIAIKVDDITHLSEAQAAESGGSSSWRQLAFALAKKLHDATFAITEADRPTRLLTSLGPGSSVNADQTLNVNIQGEIDLGDATIIAE